MSTGAVRYKVPLIGAKQNSENLKLWDKFTRPFAIVKPFRVLGAVWTSDKVARRRPVQMCEMCWRRYVGWWKKEHYRPDWGWRYVGDCDGCGTKFCSTTMFLAEEKFYSVLTEAHGRQPKP